MARLRGVVSQFESDFNNLRWDLKDGLIDGLSVNQQIG